MACTPWTGSIVPGSAAVTNPSGLIAALSERCMREMSQDVRKRVLEAKLRGLITWGADQCSNLPDVRRRLRLVGQGSEEKNYREKGR